MIDEDELRHRANGIFATMIDKFEIGGFPVVNAFQLEVSQDGF